MRMLIGVFGLFAVVAGAFVVICVLLYLGQDGSVFFPTRNDPLLVQQQQANRVAISAGEATLEGWWIENPRATTPAVILYFGGNAEDVLSTASTAASIDARWMLFASYRGYGGSTGKPGQQALYDDALAIYQHAIERGMRAEHIVVMGRSLGSGVAAMLAGSRPVRAAILITPFDSLSAVAARHYPIFPVRLLLRHPFPSVDWAKRTKAPALLLAAEHDAVVPAVHAQRLYEAWPAKKQIHVLAGTGHNDIEQHPDYYPFINEFLATEIAASRRD